MYMREYTCTCTCTVYSKWSIVTYCGKHVTCTCVCTCTCKVTCTCIISIALFYHAYRKLTKQITLVINIFQRLITSYQPHILNNLYSHFNTSTCTYIYYTCTCTCTTVCMYMYMYM